MRDPGSLKPGYYLGTWKETLGGPAETIAMRVLATRVDRRGVEWITFENSRNPGAITETDFWLFPIFYDLTPCTEEEWLCAILAR